MFQIPWIDNILKIKMKASQNWTSATKISCKKFFFECLKQKRLIYKLTRFKTLGLFGMINLRKLKKTQTRIFKIGGFTKDLK